MNDPGRVFKGNVLPIEKSFYGQKWVFMIMIAIIFLAEVIAMGIIYYIHPQQYWVETLLDASIMSLMVVPVLYYLHFQPLLKQIVERNRSEGLLRDVLENLPVGVWIIDKNSKIQHGNQASLKIWAGARYVGMDRYGEYKAWRLEDGQPMQAEDWAAARTLRDGETILNEELEIECFDGSHKMILNSSTPIWENGAIRGAIVVNQDITERVQAEQALAKSEALFKTAFQVLPVGAWITDEAGKIIFGNPAGQQIWAGAKYVGIEQFGEYKAWWLSTGQPVASQEWAITRAVKNGETSLNEELEIECFDGSHKIILNSAMPVCDEQGKLFGVFVINQDITERKNAEMLLERQYRDLNALTIAEGKQRQLAEGLVQSILSLNASLELQEVLDRILVQIRLSIPYEAANILLIEQDCLRLVHHHNPDGDLEKLALNRKPYLLEDYPYIRQMCSTRQPVLIEGVPPDQQAVPGMDWHHSYLVVPLIVGERVIGIINLTSDQPDSFSQETASRLMAFAAPAALAVENARLYAAELQARQLAETLNAASLALSQTLNFDKVMQTLLEYVSRLVPTDRAYIATCKDETNLVIQAIHGYENENLSKGALEDSYQLLDRPYLQEVISTQKSLLISDTRRYPGWKNLLSQVPIGSWLGIPFKVGDEALGVLALSNLQPDQFTHDHIWLSEVIVAQASVAIQNAWLFEQVRSGQERLRSLSRHLVAVQESERRYIARELHDQASQSLTALMFGLNLLDQEVHDSEAVRKRLAELKRLTDEVLEELHRLAMGLRPASLDYLGLSEALEQLVKDNDERYNLNMRFKRIGAPEEQPLPNHVETNIYRIVQEALTNAVRHANAKNVDIILENRSGKTTILIEDDGIGFDVTHNPKSGHLGLLGMQERAQMISGSLHVESSPGCGTTIVLEVPDADSNLDRG